MVKQSPLFLAKSVLWVLIVEIENRCIYEFDRLTVVFNIVVINSCIDGKAKEKGEVPTNGHVLWKSSSQSCVCLNIFKTKQNKQNINCRGPWEHIVHIKCV